MFYSRIAQPSSRIDIQFLKLQLRLFAALKPHCIVSPRVDFCIPGTQLVGGYSMCSAPDQLRADRTLELAVKRSTWPPAVWVHQKVSQITNWSISPPTSGTVVAKPIATKAEKIPRAIPSRELNHFPTAVTEAVESELCPNPRDRMRNRIRFDAAT